MILYDHGIGFIAFNGYSPETGYVADTLGENQWYYDIVDAENHSTNSYSGDQRTDLKHNSPDGSNKHIIVNTFNADAFYKELDKFNALHNNAKIDIDELAQFLIEDGYNVQYFHPSKPKS